MDRKSKSMNWVMVFSIMTGIFGICTVIAQNIKEKNDNVDRINDKDEIIKLQKDNTDTLKRINDLQEQLNISQAKFSGSQDENIKLLKKNTELQAESFNQILGGNKIEKSYMGFTLVDPKNLMPLKIEQRNFSRLGLLLKRMAVVSNLFTDKNSIEYPPYYRQYSPNVQIASFLQEVIQYKILTDLASIQSSDFTLNPQNDSYDYIPQTDYVLNNPVKLTTFDELNIDKIFSNYIKNDFMIKKSEGVLLKVPVGTSIELENSKKDDSLGKVTYKIILKKANYFILEFNILDRSIYKYSTTGEIPQKLKNLFRTLIAEETNPKIFSQLIILKAEFNSNAQNISKLAEYKKWTEWIFDRLIDINSIPR